MTVGSCTSRGPTTPNRVIATTRASPVASHGVMLGSMVRQTERGGGFLACCAMLVVASVGSATSGSTGGAMFGMVVCSPVSCWLVFGGR